MRTRTLLFALCALLITSCAVQRTYPSQEELQRYRDSLLLYYPYSADEQFVFVNEQLGRTWEAKPDANNGVYPITKIGYNSNSQDFKSESAGMWGVHVSAPMSEIGITHDNNNRCDIDTEISGQWSSCDVMIWFFAIRLSEKEIYLAEGLFQDSENHDVFTLFRDTLIIPIDNDIRGRFELESGKPYARIVKHQGLTDFSTDGKTVWKREK
ncbi:MAG: hypothetical protein J5884_04390 [Paludibacteraceae bacterium]|nr:hypothetical protein [Paludibacteraceae bacterium]